MVEAWKRKTPPSGGAASNPGPEEATLNEAKSIVDEAFEHVAREAVRKVIAQHVGHGIDTDVKAAIKEMANEIVRNDEEVKAKIRERLLYWIAQS